MVVLNCLVLPLHLIVPLIENGSKRYHCKNVVWIKHKLGTSGLNWLDSVMSYYTFRPDDVTFRDHL